MAVAEQSVAHLSLRNDTSALWGKASKAKGHQGNKWSISWYRLSQFHIWKVFYQNYLGIKVQTQIWLRRDVYSPNHFSKWYSMLSEPHHPLKIPAANPPDFVIKYLKAGASFLFKKESVIWLIIQSMCLFEASASSKMINFKVFVVHI